METTTQPVRGITITDRLTGFRPSGEFGLGDDMDEDVECPVCGAEVGQQCSEEDPDDKGMGIELGKYVHLERISSANMGTTTQPYAVFAVAYVPNTPLLCATTREDGTIGLPGGKVDPGEDPLKAVIREAAEEGWNLSTDGVVLQERLVDGRPVIWYACRTLENPIISNHKEAHRGIHPVAITPPSLTHGLGNDFLRNPKT
jgi:hypothetical protein